MDTINGLYLDYFKMPNEGKKTDTYKIVNRTSGMRIGLIQWYAPWRQFCLMPGDGIVFNKTCLIEINQVLDLIKNEYLKNKENDKPKH